MTICEVPPGVIDSLDNNIRDTLPKTSHEFFVGVLISAVVVVVGVALEGPAQLHEMGPEWFTATGSIPRSVPDF